MPTFFNIRVGLCVVSSLIILPQTRGGTPQNTVPAAGIGPPIPNNHQQAEAWKFAQRAYPLGRIPEGARERALKQIELSKASDSTHRKLDVGSRWVNIGPAPILDGQVAPSAPVSGRITCVAVDPGNPAHWIVGAAMGGVWETTDSGATWVPRTDGQPSLAMGAIAFAPSNPSIMFAGTGEPNASDSYAGAGLLKSTDGGLNWQVLGTPIFAKTSFSAIKVHPASANYVVVATAPDRSFQLEETGSSPVPPLPTNGVYLSTDGGANWARRLTGPVIALEVHPTNFTNQYAGVADIRGDLQGAIYRSLDAGNTWNPVAGPWGNQQVVRIALAISQSNPNRAYVCIAKDSETLLGLWRTDNAWSPTPTWTQLPNPTSAERPKLGQMNYGFALTVDPANASVIYFGEVAAWKYNGTSWAVIAGHYDANVFGTKIHPDQHAFAWAGSRLLIGNDGGMWSTTDGGTSFASHNTTLATIQFYYGSVHPTNPNRALGGEQDNGSSRWLGANGWARAGLGDGCDNAISQQNGDNNWLISYPRMGIFRVKGGGQFEDFVTATNNGMNVVFPLFVAPFAMHPANEDLVIAGEATLWKCNNMFSAATPQWSRKLGYLCVQTGPNQYSCDQISAIAFAPSDTAGTTYAFGTLQGFIGITSSDGANWVNADGGQTVPDRYVTAVAFHPNNPNILYVTLSGFDEGTPGKPGHVFKTSNALAATPNWVNVSPTVNLPHNSIAIDPANANNIYVGTDIGVWKSADGGGTWAHMGPESGMPNVAVFDLAIQPTSGRVFAFTHGRSAFMLDPNTVIEPPTVTSFSPTNGPVGTSVTITGTKFNNASQVQFGGVNAPGFVVNSGTQITATVPAGAVTGPIRVTTPGGTATSTANFTVGSTPVITGFSPTSGNIGTIVIITGVNLTGATSVSFNGTSASFTVNSATQITATVLAGATTGKIVVSTPAGTDQSATLFTVTITPVISGFSPASGAIGSSVTITGANFTASAAVAFNGISAVSPTINPPSQIIATVPAGATTGPISVATANGTTQSAASFAVIPAPTITSFTPSSGSFGTSVTINGGNFSGTTGVTFNGLRAVSFKISSDTQIVASAPSGVTTGPIRVTTPGGTAVSAGSFTALPPPSNDNFASAQVISGSSGTVLGSNGAATKETGEPEHAANLGGKSVWYRWTAPSSGTYAFNTQGSSFDTLLAVYTNSTLATLIAIASNDNLLGTNVSGVSFNAVGGTVYQIAVDGFLDEEAGELTPEPVPASGIVVLNWNLAANFPPQITGFAPVSGLAGSTVNISGLNFAGATDVTFNGASANFTINSDQQITATVPPAASSGPIRVLKPSGTATSTESFTVVIGPANDNFASALVINGSAGTLTGSNANASKEAGEPNHGGNAGGSSVWYSWTAPTNGAWRFDTVGSSLDTLLAIYTGASVGTLSLVAGNDDFGGGVNSQVSFTAVGGTTYDIAVDGHNGANGSFVLNWAFTGGLPAISSFTPTNGSVGTSVTLNGANLTGATAVRFGGVGTPAFLVNSDIQITATVPAGASSGPISVTTPNGTGQSSNNFFLTGGAPSNDNFANAISLGAATTVTGSSAGATRETSEPNHGGNAGGASVWWRWTAPSNGTYAVSTRGSDFDTLLGVYTGSAVGSLTTMGANDDGPGMGTASLVSFTATGGTTYQIAVDGYNGDSGSIILSVYATTLPQLIYFTGFENFEGYSTFLTLDGQNGWRSFGSGQNGVVFNYFFDFSQQAYMGVSSSTPGTRLFAWHPLNFTPNTNSRPLVVFSTFMEIVDSTNGRYDDFGWDVYNQNGQRLFFLDFDNSDLGIYYRLNDGGGYHFTDKTFQNGQIYYLEIAMDFGRNLWSATLDGIILVQNQPVSVTNNVALNLGDIDASWLQTSGSFGDNYFLFDNYYVAAQGSAVPRIITPPQSQTVTIGNSASFIVSVDSPLAVTYQWQFNGANLAGATDASLTLNNVTFSQAGNYSVVVSNIAGVVTSAAAVLTVAQLPNLTPYKPVGWSDKLVAATNSTSTVDAGIIYPQQDVFVSWAVLNNSTNANISSRFYFQLFLDGVLNHTWFTDGLNANFFTYVSNHNVGKLAAGTHTIRIDADATGVVAESNENDNSYTKIIMVTATNDVPPQLISPSRTANGQFQFTLTGIPLRTYEILGSTNLSNWLVLATLVNSNANGLLPYADPLSTNFNRRFYRGRLLPP